MARSRPRAARTGSRTREHEPQSSPFDAAAAGAQAAQDQLRQGLQQALLAGMGFLARAQQGGPAGVQDAVIEGLKLLGQSSVTAQRRMRDMLGTAQETLQAGVGGARVQAMGTLDGLEALFNARVQRALQQLGVPTAEEIRDLSQRVSELNDAVRALHRLQPGGRAAAPARGRKAKAAETKPSRARAPRKQATRG